MISKDVNSSDCCYITSSSYLLTLSTSRLYLAEHLISPGSTVGSATKDQSLSHVAECINRAHAETNEVVIVIENMASCSLTCMCILVDVSFQAGAGNVLGSKFSEIGVIIRQVTDKSRMGVCLDTCGSS